MGNTVWNKIGHSYVRDKENEVPMNSGQIAKEYLNFLEERENLL